MTTNRSTPTQNQTFLEWLKANGICDGNHEFRLARQKTVDHRIVYRKECRKCGNLTSQVKTPTTPKARRAPWKTDRWDDMEREFNHAKVAAFEQSRTNKDDEWWTAYNAHLESDEWRALRHRVMQRAKGLCEGCLSADAVYVHHLTYRHAFDEFAWELVAVCHECHQRVHKKEPK